MSFKHSRPRYALICMKLRSKSSFSSFECRKTLLVLVLMVYFFLISPCREMYSHRSDHSRQYNERRHRDVDQEHWEKHESHRNSHRKYGSSTERTSRSREYSESPRRQYSKDSKSRERRRQSPLRRRVPSPDWGASEKKRRRLTEDEDNYKYRRLAERKMSQQLSLDSANVRPSADFKHGDDFESRKGTKSSRHEHRHEEFDYRKRREDIVSSQLSGYHNDRDDRERTWDCSRERTRSHDDSMKVSSHNKVSFVCISFIAYPV